MALLTEHVDRSCIPALRRALADGGDSCRVCAAIALARLGAATPVEDLLALVDRRRSPELREDVVRAAIDALAVSGRRDAAAPLFALVRRDLDGEEPTARTRSAVVALGVLEERAAVASLMAIVESDDARWEYARGPAAIALGLLGVVDAARPLAALARRDDGRERLRLAAALGCALVEPAAVDDGGAEAAASGWPTHFASFEDDILPFAFALRALGARLVRLGDRALSSEMTWLVDAALSVLAGLDGARAAALRCHRGRGHLSGISTGWLFAIGDLLDDGEGALLGARHRLTALDSVEVATLVDEAAAEVARWAEDDWTQTPAGPPAMQILVDWLEERALRPPRAALTRLLTVRHRRRRAG